ncbi:hypothetical protein [Sphingomonas sp.]|uniref:hypothetical protein n=1 Tax=Sphingomonas sp. TaxID=28214 RepID=UPI00286E39FA|nr:hypothetical protein [Sphingomonas sp.]
MYTREQWDRFIDHPVVEWSIFAVGLVLMLLSPLAGVVPGPGGILVFALGLAMVLKTSMWAKRHYVKFKRWQPKAGRWVDWGLRRSSAKRREALRKERADAALPPTTEEVTQGPVEAAIPDPPAKSPETWAEREGRADPAAPRN